MNLRLPEPFAQQREFMTAKTRFVGYGGSRGGGKSFAVRLKAALMALRYAGIRILILRRSYPELLENHIKTMTLQLAGAAVYKETEKALIFVNGSRIKFGYCDNDSDLRQYQGVEYDIIFMDEATQFTEYQFRIIAASLRGANSFPKRFYITCNPGGVGHSWVKRLFIDKKYRDGESAEDYSFIRSTVYDNAPLLENDPEYRKTLESLPEDLRRAWLYGDWDVFAGQFFSEFDRTIHTCEPFPIPHWWRRYRAFDYGLDCLACIWAAADDSGNIFVYRELSAGGLIVSEAAKRICELTGDEEIYETAAPPDMWSRQKDTGASMAELFEKNGVRIVRADNNRVAGWANVREYLKPLPAPDGNGKTARLRIFTSCTELIQCLPQICRDSRDPCDCAREPHDITHICDALRYLIQARVRPGKETKQEDILKKARDAAIRRSRRENRGI